VRSTVAQRSQPVATRAIDAVYTTQRRRSNARPCGRQSMLDRYQAGSRSSFRLLYDHPPDEVHNASGRGQRPGGQLRTINLANVFAVEKVTRPWGEGSGDDRWARWPFGSSGSRRPG